MMTQFKPYEVILSFCALVFPFLGLLIGYYAAKAKMATQFLSKDDCKNCYSNVEISAVNTKLSKFITEWEEKEDVLIQMQIDVAVIKEKIHQLIRDS